MQIRWITLNYPSHPSLHAFQTIKTNDWNVYCYIRYLLIELWQFISEDENIDCLLTGQNEL